MFTAVNKVATCLLLQVLITPIEAMLLRSVNRSAISSSGDNSMASPPSWEIIDWEKEDAGPYIFKHTRHAEKDQ